MSVYFDIQRDTIQAASEFVSRNKLPKHIEEQMLSHICLRFKTEGLKQQETLDGLPKAIRSSIAEYLFFPIVQEVYLFRGFSFNLIFQLVRFKIKMISYNTRQVKCMQRADKAIVQLIEFMCHVFHCCAGEKFVGYHPTKVINQENAEIDDITVVRDGDHLYLL
ncbi:hypothetical protein BHE74_00007606 [Ensete ventricosum]|nr:hypothetical protein BHE74_00007606 [Ensete ventricosum]RZS19824.1 hypothetical protein BHM03_00052259 [Ensete ventricosum]